MTPIELLLSHELALACCNSIYAKPRCLTEAHIRESLRITIGESACEEQEARMMGLRRRNRMARRGAHGRKACGSGSVLCYGCFAGLAASGL